MTTSFVAFLNMRGIACASDTDMTLYALSKKEPVAIAVNPYSPIPWDNIINAYLRHGDIPLHNNFSDYVRDFAEFLTTIESKKKWAKLNYQEANVIFLGYGQDDLFPSAIDVIVFLDKTSNRLNCQIDEECHINHDKISDHINLGDIDNILPALYGISFSARDSLIDVSGKTDDFKNFKARITKALRKANCKVSLDNLPSCAPPSFTKDLDDLQEEYQNQLNTGIDDFFIEDLVKAAETIIDANDQLEHLKGGGIDNPKKTKELAVITRTEGLVWIKHCLFGL